MPATTDLTEHVRCLVSRLDETDLEPRPAVDSAFSELVGVALEHRDAVAEDVLAALGPDLPRLRRICALGESALERHWAARIVASAEPAATLASFPYTHNYERLVDLELGIVRGLGARVRRVGMVGSGPLPLTGIELAQRHGLDVVLFDRDPDALRAGSQVVDALGLTGRMTSVRADVGRDVLDLSDLDLVLHGALVGRDEVEKRALLTAVGSSMAIGSYVAVRSAAGLRRLLYPPVALSGVEELTLVLEAHPHDEVVNSVLVARRN